MKVYNSQNGVRLFFIIFAILIVILSVIVTNKIARSLEVEERQKMEIWAEATKVMSTEDPGLNVKLILKILEQNNSIPVVLCDSQDQMLYHKNFQNVEDEGELFWRHKIQELKQKKEPIIINLAEGEIQRLYYDDSIILKRLLLFPYIQLTVVFIFIVLSLVALSGIRRAEQNKIWVGLSKETAHQLGTPISSLMAWGEYLETENINAEVIQEIKKDINRLEVIAERFSKIGSDPIPIPMNIVELLKESATYMQTRISKSIQIHLELPTNPIIVSLNPALFSWVIENLCKNAVDAMGGNSGNITISLKEQAKNVTIDVSDTGKGIAKSKFKTVFNPGYTTKSRGWGLGLSLVKRIINSYHHGRIYVKNSELGVGTTFRIELSKYAQ